MAEEIKNVLGLDSELTKSSGGVFEVTADDRPIFSKKAMGRFPTHLEVVESIRHQSH